MKAFLVVLVLLVVGAVGFAFYEGRFHLSTDNADHKPSVTIDVDKNKFDADKKKVEDLGNKKDAAGPTEKAK